MPGTLDIVNGTLALMAQVPVSSVNDTDKSLIISNNVDRYFQDLLRREMWNFALAFIFDNTPNTTNISGEFLYNYTLPYNYGRFFRFQWRTSPQFGFYYVILDGVMMTNSRPVSYYYVVNDCSLNVISAPFEQALIYYLAAEYTLPLTNNEKLSAQNRALYYEKLADAVQQNNMELYISQTPYNSFDRQTFI